MVKVADVICGVRDGIPSVGVLSDRSYSSCRLRFRRCRRCITPYPWMCRLRADRVRAEAARRRLTPPPISPYSRAFFELLAYISIESGGSHSAPLLIPPDSGTTARRTSLWVAGRPPEAQPAHPSVHPLSSGDGQYRRGSCARYATMAVPQTIGPEDFLSWVFPFPGFRRRCS